MCEPRYLSIMEFCSMYPSLVDGKTFDQVERAIMLAEERLDCVVCCEDDIIGCWCPSNCECEEPPRLLHSKFGNCGCPNKAGSITELPTSIKKFDYYCVEEEITIKEDSPLGAFVIPAGSFLLAKCKRSQRVDIRHFEILDQEPKDRVCVVPFDLQLALARLSLKFLSTEESIVSEDDCCCGSITMGSLVYKSTCTCNKGCPESCSEEEAKEVFQKYQAVECFSKLP